MKTLKIVAAQTLKKQTLVVDEQGIGYSESGGFGRGDTTRYTFDQIDAVVQSAEEPVLSIQIGEVIHRIPFKKSDDTHKAVIAEIVAGLQRSAQQHA
jgi:hypothetical protein